MDDKHPMITITHLEPMAEVSYKVICIRDSHCLYANRSGELKVIRI